MARLPTILLAIVAIGLLAVVVLLGLESHHQSIADEEHSIHSIHHHASQHSPGDRIFMAFKKEHEHPFPVDLSNDTVLQRIYEQHPDVLEHSSPDPDEFFSRGVVRGARLALQENRPYVIMEIGVWMGVEVARRVAVHPNCHVIGVDRFDEPQGSSPKIQSLPPDLRERFGTHGTRQSEFRIRNAEYVLRRRAGEHAERTLLLKGPSAEAAFSALKWPGLHVDAFYLRDVPYEDSVDCIRFVSAAFRAFLAHNPNAMIGGERWERYACVRRAVLAVAAELDLQTAISGGRIFWVVSSHMSWLRDAHAFDGVVKSASEYQGANVTTMIEEEIVRDPERAEVVTLPRNPDAFSRFRVANIHPFPNGLLDDKNFKELYLAHPEAFGSVENGCQSFFDQVVRHGTSVEQRRFLLMQIGVGFGINVARWLTAHANCQVIGLDLFNDPILNDHVVKKLPARFRKNLDSSELSPSEVRMRLAEFGVRITGHSPKRSVLVRGEVLAVARKALKWPELQVDAVFFDSTFVRNLTDCAGFLTEAFDTFLLYRPSMYFGGEGWHDHTCLADVVNRYAAAKGLQLMIVGHCTWAMGLDLMFLNQKWPMKRHVTHPGNVSATSVPAQAP